MPSAASGVAPGAGCPVLGGTGLALSLAGNRLGARASSQAELFASLSCLFFRLSVDLPAFRASCVKSSEGRDRLAVDAEKLEVVVLEERGNGLLGIVVEPVEVAELGEKFAQHVDSDEAGPAGVGAPEGVALGHLDDG